MPNAAEEISGIRFSRQGDCMAAESVPEAAALRFASIPGYSIEEMADEEGSVGIVNYAETSITKIKKALVEDPGLHERILADEVAARGDAPRDGVVKACEDAKARLASQ